MKNKVIWIVVLVILVAGASYYMGSRGRNGAGLVNLVPPSRTDSVTKQLPPIPAAFDPKNATYNVDDMTVTLVNGQVDTEAAPGSVMMVTTQYFGNMANGDLNGDGVDDSAFIITQYGAGTGEFFYVVAVLKTTTKATVTNAVFIGDRIAPQTTEIKNGEVFVNYADRKPGQAMTDTPTVGVTKHLKISSKGELVEASK